MPKSGPGQRGSARPDQAGQSDDLAAAHAEVGATKNRVEIFFSSRATCPGPGNVWGTVPGFRDPPSSG